jgi:hypothetical protein
MSKVGFKHHNQQLEILLTTALNIRPEQEVLD